MKILPGQANVQAQHAARTPPPRPPAHAAPPANSAPRRDVAPAEASRPQAVANAHRVERPLGGAPQPPAPRGSVINIVC